MLRRPQLGIQEWIRFYVDRLLVTDARMALLSLQPVNSDSCLDFHLCQMI